MSTPDEYSPTKEKVAKKKSQIGIFGSSQESNYELKIQDLFGPLGYIIDYYIGKKKVTFDNIWRQYDKNKNMLISGKEMVPMFKKFC